MKKTLTSLLALLLAILICSGSFVSAATLSVTSGSKVTAYEDGKIKNSKTGEYYNYTNQNAMIYRSDGTTYEHERNYWGDYEVFKVKNSKGDSSVAYCIEYGIVFDSDNEAYTAKSKSSYFNRLSDAAQEGITYTLIYGYVNGKDVPVNCSWKEYWLATQIIVWEYQQKLRTTATARKSNGYASANVYYNEIKGTPAELAYNYILNKIKTHNTRPSFTRKEKANAVTYYLNYDPDTGKYTRTLTDSNNLKIDIRDLSDSGITVTRSGNKYTFSTSKKISKTTLEFQKSIYNTKSGKQPMMFFGNNGETGQTVATGASDPVAFYVNFLAEPDGSILINKEVSDSEMSLSGWKFSVTGNGKTYTATTNSKGQATVTGLTAGTYTVTETDVPSYVSATSKKTVTVSSGEQTEVDFTNSYKKGNLRITKSSENDLMTAGVQFKISGTADNGEKISKTVTTNSKGIVTAKDLPIGTYTVSEVGIDGKVPSWIIKPANQKANIKSGEVTELEFENLLKKGNLRITKSSENDLMTAGVQFKISGTADNGEKISKTVTTNSKGIVTAKNLPIGTYTVSEVGIDGKVPNWIIKPANQKVTVKYDATVEVEFENNLKRGTIEIVKDSEEDVMTAGVQFKISGTADNGEKISKTVTTNSKGVVAVKDLPIGTYTVSEIGVDGKVPNWIIKPEDQKVTVKYNAVTTVNVENKLKKGSLKIIKTSEDDAITGVKFHIFGTSESGIVIDEYVTTNKKGEAFLKDIPISAKLTVEEVDIPIRYISPEIQIVAIETDKEAVLEFENVLKKGVASLVKVCSEEENKYLSGAEFSIYADLDGDGELTDADPFLEIMKEDSGESGVYRTGELEYGQYLIKETSAPKGYYLSDTVYLVEVRENNKSFKLGKIVNEKKLGSIKLLKKSEEDVMTAGVQFKIVGVCESGENFERIYTTDENGVIEADKLPIGTYTVSEVGIDGEMPEWVIVPETQNIIVKTNEQSEVEFENVLKKGSLKIIKTSEDGVIAGVKIHISGTTDSGIKIDEYITTDENGEAFLTDIPILEELTIEEVDVPIRYISPEIQIVAIEEDKETVVNVKNVLKKGYVDLTKVCSEEENKYLSGAEFSIYADLDGDGILTLKDPFVGTMKEDSAESGTYKSDELPYGQYLIKETSAPKGYHLSDTVYLVEIIDNGETVTLGNIINEKKLGNIKLLKKSEKDVMTAGVQFKIVGVCESGESFEGVYTTDENGVIEADRLPIGSYTVEEIGINGEMPEWVIVPETQNIIVKTNEQSEVEFENVLKKGSLKIVKTSEDGVLEGHKFHIFGTSESGIVIDEYVTTDENGEAFLKDIPISAKLTVEESDVPFTYIVPAAQTVAIEENKETEVKFENKLKKGSLKIIKTSEDGVVDFVGFHIFGTTDSGIQIDEYVITDENGEAFLKDIPISAELTVEEDVLYRYVDQEAQIIKIEENKETEVKFENKLKKGSLKIVKTYEDGIIEGVVFHVFGRTEGERNSIKIDEYITTDENGEAFLTDIPILEELTIEEVDVPIRYIFPEIQIVAIEEDKETVVNVKNVLKKGYVDLTKVCSEEENKYLSGAEFSIYADLDGDGILTLKDPFIGTMKEQLAESGTYKSDELPYGQYLIKETSAPKGYHLSDTVYLVEIIDNGETVTLGKIENNKQYGKLKIVKTSEDGIIKGVEFRVVGQAVTGDMIDSIYKTNKKGVIELELPIGTYTVSEVKGKNMEKYILPEDVIVEVKADETTEVTMNNRLLPPDVPNPDTGVESVDYLFYITLIAFIGFFVTVKIFKRQKA